MAGAVITSWGRRHMAPSWRHAGSVMWRPPDIMTAPSLGTLLMSWGRRHLASSWRHDGAIRWRPHDIMGIVRPGEAFGQFSKPDWVSTVMSFDYLDNWQLKWNIANLSQQKVKVKLDFIITQNKCSDQFLSKWYHNIVRMSVDVSPWTLMSHPVVFIIS